MNTISRRGVLALVAAGVAGRTAARTANTARFAVEQGDRCVPITPLSGGETVEEFYDYRTPETSPSGAAYSSYGTTDLQRPETSICFLYDGPQGLSLVVVHDELEDGTPGGAVTFRFDGLAGGAWVVGDDDYDASSNYDTFAETSDGWRVDWTWAEGRSDGGAYRSLGENFAVTIDPAFNGDAELYGRHYEGELTDWEFLSGDQRDPERISLALDEPITIRAGGCSGRSTTRSSSEDEGDRHDHEDEETEREKEDEEREETEAEGESEEKREQKAKKRECKEGKQEGKEQKKKKRKRKQKKREQKQKSKQKKRERKERGGEKDERGEGGAD